MMIWMCARSRGGVRESEGRSVGDVGATLLARRADCPFSHSCRLLMEVDDVPYKVRTIDLAAKPEWFTRLSPSGTVPLLLVHDGAASDGDDSDAPPPAVVDGSASISEWVIDHVELSRGSPAPGSSSSSAGRVGARLLAEAEAEAEAKAVFPSFVAYIKKEGGADEAERRALLDALGAVEARLANGEGTHWGLGGREYMFGRRKTISWVDAAFAPKLHHMYVALAHHKGEHFKDATGAPLFPRVDEYMAEMRSLPAWERTSYPDELVVEGWAKHVPALKGAGRDPVKE